MHNSNLYQPSQFTACVMRYVHLCLLLQIPLRFQIFLLPLLHISQAAILLTSSCISSHQVYFKPKCQIYCSIDVFQSFNIYQTLIKFYQVVIFIKCIFKFSCIFLTPFSPQLLRIYYTHLHGRIIFSNTYVILQQK